MFLMSRQKFAELLQRQKKETPPSMPELLQLSRSTVQAPGTLPLNPGRSRRLALPNRA